MSLYANGLNVNINEVAVLTFLENVNGQPMAVCQVAVTYETLKQIYAGMGSVIAQHDANLGSAFSDRARAN